MPIQKILIVDDSKTELHHLSEILTKRGYSVRTAENGEEAQRRLAEDKPQLILMDVVMPGQNGFQLTRAITRDPRFADVPVIMCTSKNQETDKVWGPVGVSAPQARPFGPLRGTGRPGAR
jgi:twitching motility two-component system response regulator PilH